MSLGARADNLPYTGASVRTGASSAAKSSRGAARGVVAEVLPLRPIVLTVEEVAQLARCSKDTIWRALRATDPGAYPPPLVAAGRHGPRGVYIVALEEVERWIGCLARWVE